MGRAPCCSKVGLHRGPWAVREDTLLTKYIQAHGEGHWRSLPKKAGLLRCGKSCRLRWMNYLRPDIKRGNISPDEEDLIIRLHSLLGNRWSLIAGRLPGRTDNEIKNYWNTHLSKRFNKKGIHPEKKSRTREPRKRKTKTSTTNKQEQNNEDRANRETETKIHLPKPFRFTSLSLTRNNSFESGSHSGVAEGDVHGGLGTETVDLPWSSSELNDGGDGCGFLIANGSDVGTESQLPTKENMFQRLYEEYLQLLKKEEGQDQVNLDTFAESLWV